MPSAQNSMRVVIAGGGIGGLSAALSLANAGARVQVFEKRADPSEEGAGIQIGPNATRILRRLGIAETLAKSVSAPQCLRVHDAVGGTVLTELPLGDWLAQRHGSPYWVAHRADLHRALKDAAEVHPQIELIAGTHIDRIWPAPDEVAVEAAGEVVGRGDLLVAADGLHSALRKDHFNVQDPHFAGKSAARSVIPMERVPGSIPRHAVGIWLSPEGHVVHYPVRGGMDMAIVVIRASDRSPPGWAAVVDTAWVHEAVDGFPSPVLELVSAASAWKRWSLYRMPPLETWVSGRIVLLGDAAHPVLPFLAQGAVLALEDGAVLAQVLGESIVSGTGLAEALSTYDTLRRPRALAVQAASKRNGEIYHLSGAMRHARNLVLRATPPSRLMAAYDWLYGWRL